MLTGGGPCSSNWDSKEEDPITDMIMQATDIEIPTPFDSDGVALAVAGASNYIVGEDNILIPLESDDNINKVGQEK